MGKRMTMAEAIARYVPDSTSVTLGLALEALIPYATGFEIMRQQRHGVNVLVFHVAVLPLLSLRLWSLPSITPQVKPSSSPIIQEQVSKQKQSEIEPDPF